MIVKVTIYKRVLLSYEVEVETPDHADKESLIQAVHEYAPEGTTGWEESGTAEYDHGVPRAVIKEIKGKLPYFDPSKGIVIDRI